MKKLTLLLALMASAFVNNPVDAQKTVNLFNGKDLSNWDFVVEGNKVPASDVYYVQDGLIRIAGQPIGYMYTKEIYKNFKLHVEWRWVDGKESNSGIFVLVEDVKNPFPKAVECQLHAGDAGDFVLLGGSDLIEYQKEKNKPRPEFPVVKKDKESTEKAAGEWNEANIFVRDGVITVYINGVYQNTGTSLTKEGHVALQSEGGPIEFRNVKLTPME